MNILFVSVIIAFIICFALFFIITYKDITEKPHSKYDDWTKNLYDKLREANKNDN